MRQSHVFLVGGPYHGKVRAIEGPELVVEDFDYLRALPTHSEEESDLLAPVIPRRGKYTPSKDQPSDPVWVWLFRGWAHE